MPSSSLKRSRAWEAQGARKSALTHFLESSWSVMPLKSSWEAPGRLGGQSAAIRFFFFLCFGLAPPDKLRKLLGVLDHLIRKLARSHMKNGARNRAYRGRYRTRDCAEAGSGMSVWLTDSRSIGAAGLEFGVGLVGNLGMDPCSHPYVIHYLLRAHVHDCHVLPAHNLKKPT